jgi:predicted transcriptional regulator of viral defense system
MTDLPATYRRRLHERALEQYGYVTTADAADLGIPRIGLQLVAHRGGLTNVAYGLYRFDDIPATGREGYMEAVLAVGRDAFLYADAVLALHDLALVNPVHIRVGTPRVVRKRTLPPTVRVVRVTVPADDLETYEGIPCTTIARALLDCIGIVMPDRLLDAANDADARGLFRRRDRERVFAALGR